uniref:V-set and transmembrane domain-containing protein 5-like isoform X2 n=1 Tax=Pristiophorus japonicus TaxID=55135 RepID=UPI00398F5C4B
MVTLTPTAVTVCLLISAVEPQYFTIQTENSWINVTAGDNALFSVAPSAGVQSGRWEFEGRNIVAWNGTTGDIINDYTNWTELFLPNGSLLLKWVTVSDSGEYTVTMIPNIGIQASATITLHVVDQFLDDNNIRSGAIAGIVIAALFSVGLISGISVWLVKRKAAGMEVQKRGHNNANVNSTVRAKRPEANATTPVLCFPN